MLQSVVSCGLWFVLFLLWYALRNKQPIYIHEINKATNVNMCEKLKKQLIVTFHYTSQDSTQDANKITDIRGPFRIASMEYFILTLVMNSKTLLHH